MASNHTIKRCKPLLGTFIEVDLYGELPEKDLVHWSNIAFNEIERIHHALSFHAPESDISVLNRALLTEPQSAHNLTNDLSVILAFAHALFKSTQGYYDLSVASKLVNDKHLPDHLFLANSFEHNQPLGTFADVLISNNQISSKRPIIIDLGGVAKGYAVDQAIALLPEDICGSINAGGDMRVIDWQNKKVEIKYGKRFSALKKLQMANTALATSASYYNEGGSQYFNPIANHYVKIKGSMSVFSEKAMHADALTKVALLVERQQAKQILKDYNATAISINRFGFSRQLS